MDATRSMYARHVLLPTGPWSQLADLRARIEAELAGEREDLRDAILMTLAELAENALKYGARDAEAPPVVVEVELDARRARVAVTGGAGDRASVAELARHVERLRASCDPGALYRQRMLALLGRPGGPSRLGIYRIGHEGRFGLSWTQEDDLLTMTAIRELSPPGGAPMERLQHEGLTIETASPRHLRLAGEAAMRDPLAQAQPFLRRVHEAARGGGDVTVDVTDLRYVSSSAIQLFIDWIGWILEEPEGARYKLRFLTSQRFTWQAAAFPALGSLAGPWLEVVTSP
jgi:hypothetical protein